MLSLGLLGVALTAPPAHGDPLDWGLVPQKWNWCAHLDVDNLKKSSLAVQIIDQIIAQNADLRKLREIPLIDLNPGEDIKSATILGTRFSPEKGIVLLRGRFDQKQLVALVSLSPRYETQTFEGKVLHRWWDEDQNSYMTGTFLSEDRLAFGKDEAALRAIITASTANPTTADPFFVNDPQTFFVFHARGLDELPLPFVSPIVKRSRRLSLAIGQRGDQAFAVLAAEFQSPSTAGDVRDVLAGLAALGRLQNADHPRIYELLQPIRFTTEGNVVRGEWEGSSAALQAVWEKDVVPKFP
ncbi:MAG: hypothetical protein GYA33_08190 [Thermogutta sp.]|nr:hypothetical protein [Thermogutta sp.]